MGCGMPFSTALRKAWSKPTPGLPAQLKITCLTQPAAIIWSTSKSGVSLQTMRFFFFCRIISCPRAKGIPCVKPPKDTRSPSFTNFLTASLVGSSLFSIFIFVNRPRVLQHCCRAVFNSFHVSYTSWHSVASGFLEG